MVALLAQAARAPPLKPLIPHLVAQIVLHGLRDQNLGLLRQARNVRETRRPAARAPPHEALLRFPVEGLRADEARLTFRVIGAFLDRDGYGLRVLLICVVLFGAASLFYLLTELVVATLFPVFFLASRPTVACAAAAAFLAQL